MCGFGVTSRPFEDGLEIGRVLDLQRGLVVEGRVMYDTDGLAGDLVAEGEEMRKVVFAEGGVVLLQAADALGSDSGVLPDGSVVAGHGLDLPAVFQPFLLCPFLFREVHAAGILQLGTWSHLLHEEAVLILVDGLDELRCDVGIKLTVVLKPFVEGHEDLDGIYHIGRLVKLFNGR